MQLTVRAAADVAREDLLATPIVYIGRSGGNPWLDSLDLPLQASRRELRLFDRHYGDPGHVAQLGMYPHPLDPAMPLSLLTGNSDTAILHHLVVAGQDRWSGIFSERWGFQVWLHTDRQLTGLFDDAWQPDARRTWDFSGAHRTAFVHPVARLFTHGFEVPEAALAALADSLAARREQVRVFCGQQTLPPPPIDVHLYASAEYMGLMRNRMEQAYTDLPAQAIHRLHAPIYAGKETEHENRLWLRYYLGKPALLPLEEGLAAYLAPRWLGSGYAYWAARLYDAHAGMPLADLLDPASYAEASPYLREALAASLVAFLIDRDGPQALSSTYWQAPAAALLPLEAAWHSFLADLAAQHPARPRRTWQPIWAAGMTLAHEGYSIYNGYGSGEARAAIAHLADLHTNSLAIVPYTGARETTVPTAFPIWQRAGSENDASVVATIEMARAQGMSTLLKPQIWFRGGWPGDVNMQNDADWQAFFAHYRHWIQHYALLAEIYEADMFCVGVEFVQATRKHPEAWRTLIRDLRQLYRGPVTYAANWGEEIENLAFADELDFVGLNCYYPLAAGDSASDAELARNFGEVMTRMRKLSRTFGKPFLLTEIGFRSISSPWQHPHAEAGDRAANALHQARCYRVVLDELARQTEWCRGIYWWKWSSYLDHGQEDIREYTPYAKPAEQLLRQSYEQLRSR
ncbi:MAG: hypothetical protein OHK0039_19200 [Bacteroidia bacterium]